MIKKSAGSLALRLLSALTGFLFSVVVARTLGVDQAGVFFLAYSIVIPLSVFVRLGYDQYLVRTIASDLGNTGKVVGVTSAAILHVLFIALIVAAALSMLSSQLAMRVFSEPELIQPLRIMSAALPCLALSFLASNVFQARGRILLMQLSQNLAASSLAILVLCGLAIGGVSINVRTAAWAFLGSWLIACIPALLLCRSLIPIELRARIPLATAWSAVRIFFATQTLNQTILWGGAIVLGALAHTSEVAVYTVAQRTAVQISLIMIALNAVMAPRIARFFAAKDMESLRATAVWGMRMGLFIASPIVMVLLLVPEWVLSLFGEPYTAGSNTLRALALAHFLNIYAGMLGMTLNMARHESLVLLGSLLTVVTLLSASFFLAPSMGASGVGLAFTIALACQTLFLSIASYRKLGLGPASLLSNVGSWRTLQE